MTHSVLLAAPVSQTFPVPAAGSQVAPTSSLSILLGVPSTFLGGFPPLLQSKALGLHLATCPAAIADDA